MKFITKNGKRIPMQDPRDKEIEYGKSINELNKDELKSHIDTMQNDNPNSPYYRHGYLMSHAKNRLSGKRTNSGIPSGFAQRGSSKY